VENERRANIKVGLTVLIGVAVLLVGIWLGKGLELGSRSQVVKALFPTAGGLELGDPVTINGLKRGKVTAIELQDQDVLVTMEFPERIALKKDAQASIMMFELMGGKKVELVSGRSADELPNGAVIRGDYTGDIGSLVAMVGSLSETVKSVAIKADTLLGSLNGFFADGDLRGDVDRTLSNADRALTSVDRLAGRADRMISENSAGLKNTLAEAQTALTDINGMLRENRPGIRAFIDSASYAMSSAQTTLGHANRLLVRLDSVLTNVNDKKTTIGRLLRDEQFATSLDSMIVSVRKLADQLRKQGLDANVRFFNSATPEP
jgi:phospholipid/cholesterol/gamma-HCH transport system substrate-binding protein